PIQAVVVKTNASNQTVATDANGYFSIPIDNQDTELVFSMLGFGKETVKIGGNTEYTVQLMPSVESLNEVVVVGYGVQKRSDITGAISSVTTEQINKMPTTSINEMLRGAAPGVQVTMGSAAPGGSSNILIRGRRSLSAGNDPLYVVDGVPMARSEERRVGKECRGRW